VANKQMKDLNALSSVELAAKLRETEGALFQSRMKQVTGQLSDSAQLWRMRKTIARIKTLQAQHSALASEKAVR
jgi:large subunit ribosomal protein L29